MSAPAGAWSTAEVKRRLEEAALTLAMHLSGRYPDWWDGRRAEEAGLREHAWQRLAALDEVRGQIASHVRTGALAAHQIDEEKRRER